MAMSKRPRAQQSGSRSFLNTESDIKAPASPLTLPEPTQGAVALHDVTFRYPMRPDIDALSALTLDVAAGETVALVGPSGAGKTTVFQLLLRFYDPTKGHLTFDGSIWCASTRGYCASTSDSSRKIR